MAHTSGLQRYRSKLEQTFARIHPAMPYEDTRLNYDVTHTYTPDFKLSPNIFVEVKGLFDSADRSKHLYIKKQHPHISIIFVFQNPNLKLTPTSKKTYADWCVQYGFRWLHIKDAAVLSAEFYNSNAAHFIPLFSPRQSLQLKGQSQ